MEKAGNDKVKRVLSVPLNPWMDSNMRAMQVSKYLLTRGLKAIQENL